MTTNRDLFATTELAPWRDAGGLSRGEQAIIDRYFDPAARTVEAGCGGGSLLEALHALSFQALEGFDFVHEMVEAARERVPAARIATMSAEDLEYRDATFRQALYLQQILSVVETAEARVRAVQEAYRILAPGGVAVFSFLPFEARSTGLWAGYLAHLALLRRLGRRNTSLRLQPWLRRSGRWNLRALLDRPPYVFRPTISEAVELLRGAGFSVRALAGTGQAAEGVLVDDASEVRFAASSDKLFVVCTKPSATAIEDPGSPSPRQRQG